MHALVSQFRGLSLHLPKLLLHLLEIVTFGDLGQLASHLPLVNFNNTFLPLLHCLLLASDGLFVEA